MAPWKGWTPLHEAAKNGDLDAVRRLLQEGADPNAREPGDNTTPLNWGAVGGHLETVRALLDAGADPVAAGDLHQLEVLGWAIVWRPDDIPHDVVALLLERGARHHIFTAIAAGDPELIRRVVAEDPAALARRQSRFERGLTPLHYALDRERPDLLKLLIELGADLEAGDASGQTALATAMLRGDREAIRLLFAAGARVPEPIGAEDFQNGMARLAGGTRKLVPSLNVPDIGATLAWYVSIGFTEVGRHEEDGVVNWGMLSFGKAELMLGMGPKRERENASLWFYTEKVEGLYRLLKARQLAFASQELAEQPAEPAEPAAGPIEFEEELYQPFYGGRQFSIRDPNGYALIFYDERG